MLRFVCAVAASPHLLACGVGPQAVVRPFVLLYYIFTGSWA